MPKQIYIDENGNELLVSGTINSADMLPITSSSATNTKSYIDSKIPTINDFIRFTDLNIGTITIGANGYVNITSLRPAAPTGFSFLCCFVATYSETSSKDGAMTVNAGGDYLNGAPNSTVTGLRVRYVFIKST